MFATWFGSLKFEFRADEEVANKCIPEIDQLLLNLTLDHLQCRPREGLGFTILEHEPVSQQRTEKESLAAKVMRSSESSWSEHNEDVTGNCSNSEPDPKSTGTVAERLRFSATVSS